MNHVVGEGRPYEQLQAPLRRILEKVLETYADFTQVVGMSNFMPLLDLFQGGISPLQSDLEKLTHLEFDLELNFVH